MQERVSDPKLLNGSVHPQILKKKCKHACIPTIIEEGPYLQRY